MKTKCPGVLDLTWRMNQVQVQQVLDGKPWTIRGATRNKSAIGIAGGAFVGYDTSVINFWFYDEQLCEVDLYFLDLPADKILDQYDALKRLLIEEYGEPAEDSLRPGALAETNDEPKTRHTARWSVDNNQHEVTLDIDERHSISLTYADAELRIYLKSAEPAWCALLTQRRAQASLSVAR